MKKCRFLFSSPTFLCLMTDQCLPLQIQVGAVFVFNLVVGTGSLLLPSAFAKTGWILSSVLITFLAFTSYLTVTFVIEALSCSNAILKWRRLQFLKRERVS